MQNHNILDVTLIEPRLKHPTIFQHFDALGEDESFIISNDHDPKPLYYQLLGERGKTFAWEYLKEGPALWQIKITKNVKAEHQQTIGEIAANNIQKAEVFKRLGIDFCCGGKQTLEEAAASVGIPTAKLIHELENFTPSESTHGANLNFDSWDLGFLADYITNIHHSYVKEQGPLIRQLAQKVAQRHGAESQHLIPLMQTFNQLVTELNEHIIKEDQNLFPVIKNPESAKKLNTSELNALIEEMRDEHNSAGEAVIKIKELTQNYTLPQHACNSYAFLYAKLKEFEDDLIQHIHLENNILFPKSIKKLDCSLEA